MAFDIIPGYIYSALFPFSDLSAEKRRPLLALEPPEENGDVKVAFITATPTTGNACYKLLPEDFIGEELKYHGYVHIDKTFNIHRSRIEKPVAQLNNEAFEKALRKLIGLHIPRFASIKHSAKAFDPGKTIIPPSGKVIGAPELENMVEASLDGWLTTGRFNQAFEKRLAEFLGVKHVLTTNSGSSANLLALAALTSPKLGEKALKPGDEIIAVAAGFPTTVNPALQYGLIPVFVDVHLPTYNIDPAQIEAAVSDKTRAIMIAHTLGNPFDLDEVMRIARKYDLWVIEDCCDALGSAYTSQSGDTRLVGTFGDIGTLSFYPAHHITMGEGGAVFTNSGKLKPIIESFRDWGRDCFCEPGKDNSCGKRFCWKLGDLPHGYDHKYTYSHVGYNLKIGDMQAACGLAQMDQASAFIQKRKNNFSFLKNRLSRCEEFLLLPQATPNSDPSWFGFPITIRQNAPIERVDLLQYLDKYKVGTRLVFAGNLTKQPYMIGRKFRVSGELTNTDIVMNNAFWIGVQPALTETMMDYSVSKIEAFLGIKS